MISPFLLGGHAPLVDWYEEIILKPENKTPAQGFFQFEEVAGEITGFCSKYKIPWNGNVTPRPEQIRFADLFLQDDGDWLCSGQTGAGKTLAALLVAIAYNAPRVLWLATTHELVKQPLEKEIIKLGIDPNNCALIKRNGEIPDLKTRFLFMTPQQALRNMCKIFPNKKGLIICDELDKFVGNSPGANVIRLRPEGVRVLGLSATPDPDINERVGIKTIRQADLPSEGGFREYKFITVKLSNERIKDLLQEMMDQEIKIIKSSLLKSLREEVEKELEGKIPAVSDLLIISRRIDNVKDLPFESRMALRRYERLYHYLVGYMQLGDAELMQSIKKARKGAEKKREAFNKNPSKKVFRNATFEVENKSEFKKLLKILGSLEEDLESKLIEKSDPIHPKETQLLSLLRENKVLLETGGCIIYVSRVSTAKILSQRLQRDGFSAGYIVGEQTKRQLADRQKTIDGFRKGEINILVGTETVLRGIDSGAKLVIAFDMPREPRDFIQLAGRIREYGLVVSLITEGSPDQHRSVNAKRRLKKP